MGLSADRCGVIRCVFAEGSMNFADVFGISEVSLIPRWAKGSILLHC
jgi:hypothetical protein